MNQDGSFPWIDILIAVVCVANICLLVVSTFYRGRRRMEETDSKEKLGLVALFFALSSQIFYFLMIPWAFGWRFLDRDSPFHQVHVRFPTVGILLSAVSFFVAWFAGGMRRYVSLWVAVTTGFLCILAEFAFWFSPL